MKEKRSEDCASSRGQGAEDRAGVRDFQNQSRGLKLQGSPVG